MAKPQQNTTPYTPNERISKEQALAGTLATLERRRDELGAVLPPDITFDQFHAIANQALRKNPDLLDCQPRSLINAFVAAAYDGLKIDGREACIVPEWATPKGGGKKVKQARYMSMYQGMAQQVLRGGMVTALSADVIYEHDNYRLLSGTQRGIFHEPRLVGDRGKPVAVYNVATFPNGQTDFVYLTGDQVIEIQKDSATGWKDNAPAGVWRDHRDEQWKKTAIRRHRKTLPVPAGYVIRDSEASADFPQYQSPDRLAAPPRPTRGQIAHDPNSNGTPMDLGGGFEDEGELVEGGGNSRENTNDSRRDEQQGQRQQQTVENAAVDMPVDGEEWAIWARDMKSAIMGEKTADLVNAVVARERKLLDAYPAKAEMQQFISDRIADLVSGGDDSGAAAAGDDDTTAAGAN